MTSPAENRIRLTILGGFLGSGKTTWLRHQLHHGQVKNAHVIVNEAAEVSVDDVLLTRSSRLSVVASGCACCDGRLNLIAILRELCDARVNDDNPDGRFDQIVLETSGLADPGRIVDAICGDPVLLHHIVLSEIVVAVDAVYGLEQLMNEPLGRRQVEAADRLVVTKTDATDPKSVAKLLATLNALNPGATVSGAVMGSVTTLPDFSAATALVLPDILGGDGSPIISTTVDLDPAVDWTAFSLWLSALLHARGDDLMRIKGVVRTPAGRLLVQTVRKIVQSPEILPTSNCGDNDDSSDGSIVFIGRGFEPENLLKSLHHFAGMRPI